MDVYITNIPPGYDEGGLKHILAPYVRAATGREVLSVVFGDANATSGFLCLPSPEAAEQFLSIHGSAYPRQEILLGSNTLKFSEGFRRAFPPLHQPPYNYDRQNLAQSRIPVRSIQFGWMCRDNVFSIETEAQFPGSQLSYNSERHEIRILVGQPQFDDDYPLFDDDPPDYFIAIRPSSIDTVSASISAQSGECVIFFRFEYPPFFLKSQFVEAFGIDRLIVQRLRAPPFLNNPDAVPFTNLSLRVVLSSVEGLYLFRSMARLANLRGLKQHTIVTERRNLFSASNLQVLRERSSCLPWNICFQASALLYNRVLDPKEILQLLPVVNNLKSAYKDSYVARILQSFGFHVKEQFNKRETSPSSEMIDITAYFMSFCQRYRSHCDPTVDDFIDPSLYWSLHLTCTPTSFVLSGPFLEKSNRVIRQYDTVNHQFFLRLEFRDENMLVYQHDPDIDGMYYVATHVMPYLRGWSLRGRQFEFIGYSMSSLRNHSVWLVCPFQDSVHGNVNATAIIRTLGSFENLSYDPELMFCPARYGARLAQAFTATESATVSVDNINSRDDIKTSDGKYIFTDGSGEISPELSDAIWNAIGTPGASSIPQVYQIRFQGAKGMVSVDERLRGSKSISLRPSMIKFNAAERTQIEIAKAIDQPTPFYLNRPLIMVLENLGVPYEVFQDFQDQAVAQTKAMSTSLDKASHLIQSHGLGSSFRLSSTFLGMEKFGGKDRWPFSKRLLQMAVFHILRDLRNHTRIPIPDSWTLVGVADAYGYLKEGEIFVCIKHPTRGTFYLEGEVLISRSPVAHPGDVQLATAIGEPPNDSPFSKVPLPNSVVFSVQGSRPLPSCLGGGDLDGDEYNVIPLNIHPYFKPKRISPPADYTPPIKLKTYKPCTIDDVAAFVRDYILSDTLGVISATWLNFADRSPQGVFDGNCLTLSKLQSDAVDYPKTGNPVSVRSMPRYSGPKPDWKAPETVYRIRKSDEYYLSQSAIGKLARAIELDEIIPSTEEHSADSDKLEAVDERYIEGLAKAFNNLDIDSFFSILVFPRIQREVRKHVRSRKLDTTLLTSAAHLFNWFANEIALIASICSLSHGGNKPLSEEEVVVGTIVQRTSNVRQRKLKIDKLKERTQVVVNKVRQQLEKDGNTKREVKDYLSFAWMAWMVALIEIKRKTFGAQSFELIVLGAVFDAVKILDESKAERRS